MLTSEAIFKNELIVSVYQWVTTIVIGKQVEFISIECGFLTNFT